MTTGYEKKENDKVALTIAIISIIISGCSFGGTIYFGIKTIETTEKSNFLEGEFYRIENETHNAIEPFLKPILNIDPTRIEESYHLEDLQLDLNINLPIYNYGKGIAENLTIRFFTAILDRSEIRLWEIPDPEFYPPLTSANDIYPEQTIFFTKNFYFIDDSIELNVTRIAFIIRTEYADKVTNT